jgi:uncharacterized repeat protein (TIGR03803 family)
MREDFIMRRSKNHTATIRQSVNQASGHGTPLLEALESRLLLSSYALSTLVAFDYSTTGANPKAVLAVDAQHNVYGTTSAGNATRDNAGTVFEMAASNNALTTINFLGTASNQGGDPEAGVVRDASGNLFGTTATAGLYGLGTVYEIPAGTTTILTLHSFSGGSDGSSPSTGLVLDAHGNIFGTTNGGTADLGTIFEIPAGGFLQTLALFLAANGSHPSDLTIDAQGNLYGTSEFGANGYGTVFEVPAGSGSINTLYAFTGGTDGANPLGGVVRDTYGDIFGTASSGGTAGDGTVFEIQANGTFGAVSFDSTKGTGSDPVGDLAIDARNDVFGTTYGGGANGNGTAFEIPGGANNFSTIYSFTGGSDGATPVAGPSLDSQGDIYGTTYQGGAHGAGTIFKLVPTAGPATHLAFIQNPSNTGAGSTIAPSITVTVEDASGLSVTSDTSSITLTVASGPGGAILGGTVTEPVHNGLATFSDLYLPTLGQYTLRASDGALTATVSTSFAVAATAHEKYVTQLYQDLFHRAPDSTGLHAWVSQLDAGQSYAVISSAIVGSREYDGDVIDSFYVTYLGRHAESGASGIDYWINKMQAGLSAETIRAGILGSDEYYVRVGNTDTALITALYRTFLGRDPEPGPTAIPYWEKILLAQGREVVSAGISDSDENRTDIITSYYETYLHRSPDPNGLTVWKSLLQSGVSEPVIVSAFVSSPEYLVLNKVA